MKEHVQRRDGRPPLPLDFGHWMVDRVSLNLRVLNPSPQGSTRGLGLRPPAPGPLWRGDRRRRRNCTGSESEADSRAFQVVVTIGAESWTPISQGILCKRVRCVEPSAPKVAIDAQSIIQLPKSSGGNERVIGTHPERVIGTHLGLQDSRSGQDRQLWFIRPSGPSWPSSTRGSGSSRRSSRKCDSGGSDG